MNNKPAKVKLYKGFCELKRLRQALGLSQTEISKKCGVSLFTYYRYETGYEIRNKTILQKIKRQKYLMLCNASKGIDFNLLKTMRLRADLTQEQAAKKLKISRSLYAYIERKEKQRPEIESRARALFQEIIDDLESEI